MAERSIKYASEPTVVGPGISTLDFTLKRVDSLYQEVTEQQVDLQIRDIQSSIIRQRRVFDMLRIASLNFRDLLETMAAVDFFSSLFPHPKRAKLGMIELCVNAIEHGNLGITAQERNALVASGRWLDEMTKRLSDKRYQDRRVHVYCYEDEEFVKVTVRDEGEGFNPEQYLEAYRTPDIHQLNGHGLAMVKYVAFDDMGYEGKGNIVWGLQYFDQQSMQ